jgi:hypothetical protein
MRGGGKTGGCRPSLLLLGPLGFAMRRRYVWTVSVGVGREVLHDLRSNILKNCSRDSACQWIQLVREVVLRKHGVSWVRAVGVVPWLKLFWMTEEVSHCLLGRFDMLFSRYTSGVCTLKKVRNEVGPCFWNDLVCLDFQATKSKSPSRSINLND